MFNRYEALLSKLMDLGVKFGNSGELIASDLMPSAPILRHDIDFSLHGVIDLAKIESSNGIKSIFLFRPDSTNYNLFSRSNASILNMLVSLGHSIGAHLDFRPELNSYENEELHRNYKKCIESLTGLELQFVSWHRPLSGVLGGDRRYIELENLYSNFYWDSSMYVSDSSGVWGDKQVLKLEKLALSGSYFQLLIHPEWWSHSSSQDSFAWALAEQAKHSLSSLQDEIRTYTELDLYGRTMKSLTNGHRSV